MLIRLCGHFLNNPNHIDKLIAIKGLPSEWFFRETKHGKELMRPWEPDVEANIPKDIRHLCEPVEITRVFPPIEKGKDPVIDKVTILGVRFDFMSQPGQELWEKIERFVDRMTPRDQKIPVPVLVAPDHKSAFNPHAVRRTVRGSLEFFTSDIPEVDLRVPTTQTITLANAPPPTVEMKPPLMEVKAATVPLPPAEVFNCDQCEKQFLKKQALVMHKRAGHKVEAPKVTAGA